MTEATESGDGAAAGEAVTAVDEDLLAGISALASGEAAMMLETVFFRARLGDAHELVVVGEMDRAATVGEPFFARFGEDEADLHKPVEGESEELYRRLGGERLAGLVENVAADNANATAAHAEDTMDILFEFEAAVGAAAEMPTVEAAFFGVRGSDVAALV